jgi:hypothetical protein
MTPVTRVAGLKQQQKHRVMLDVIAQSPAAVIKFEVLHVNATSCLGTRPATQPGLVSDFGFGFKAPKQLRSINV